MKKIIIILGATVAALSLAKHPTILALSGIAAAFGLTLYSLPPSVRRRVSRLEERADEARHRVEYLREVAAYTKSTRPDGSSSALVAESRLHSAEAELARLRAEIARLRALIEPEGR